MYCFIYEQVPCKMVPLHSTIRHRVVDRSGSINNLVASLCSTTPQISRKLNPQCSTLTTLENPPPHNPTDFQKSQPTMFNPYNPGEPPPQGNVPQEGQQVAPPVCYTPPQDTQQEYASAYHNDGQYPSSQWNNAQQNDNHSVPQQPWGQPLNGMHQMDPNNVNPQSWSPAQIQGQQPITDSGQDQQSSGNYQPYENIQQNQSGRPSQTNVEYPYHDHDNSHKGFGSFFHDDDSDFLGSSGTPSLSASQRQTPDNVLNADGEPHQQEAPQHSSVDQLQMKDTTYNDAHFQRHPYYGQPSGEPDQFTSKQREEQTHLSNQPEVPHLPVEAFNQEHSGAQVPFVNTDCKIDSAPNMIQTNSQTINQVFSCSQNQGDGTISANDQPSNLSMLGQPELHIPDVPLDQQDSNLPRMRNDAARLPGSTSPPSELGYAPEGSAGAAPENTVQPTLQIQRDPSVGDDQISNHSRSSPVLEGSANSRSQTPSTSTSRSNSMLGDQSDSGHPSPSPAFRDPSLKGESPAVSQGSPSSDVVAASQVEQNKANETANVRGGLGTTSIEQNGNEMTVSDTYNPQVSAVAPAHYAQQTQPNDALPVAVEQSPFQVASLDPHLGQGVQTQTRSAELPPLGLPKLNATHSQPTIPQGPNELSPTDEKTPATHPSAFRSVQRGQHSVTSVNPSPPLWSAEVPAMPANILLAPAAPPSASLVLPVRLSTPQASPGPSLAASVASVSVPSLPSEAVSLLCPACC